MKLARISKGLMDGTPYQCKFPWPEDCFCQGGGDGVVFTEGTMQEALSDHGKAMEVVASSLKIAPDPKHSYRTAFFEAFPDFPYNRQSYSTYLRGEGKDVPEAEAACWAEYQKVLACEHDFRAYPQNGGGECRKCGVHSSHMFVADLRRGESECSPLEVACEAWEHGHLTPLNDWVSKWFGKPYQEANYSKKALEVSEVLGNLGNEHDSIILRLAGDCLESPQSYWFTYSDLDFNDERDFCRAPQIVTDALLRWSGITSPPPRPPSGQYSQAAHDERKAKYKKRPVPLPLPR